MIKLFSQIESLKVNLESLMAQGRIADFHIVLSANNEIVVYFKQLNNNGIPELIENFPDTRFVSVNDENIGDYDFWFSEPNRVDVNSSRLRLSSLFSEKFILGENPVPVVTFYSYKGGVGRSTTLASCAAHFAIQREWKIVILDCDFEAPGFTNFFLEDPSVQNNHDGIMEYLFDLESNEVINLQPYYWEASKVFSGDGSIYIFPAGNLDANVRIGDLFPTHLDHYLNGLSHLDMMSDDVIVTKMRMLISRIAEELHPNVILLDSRTGFSDFFSSGVLNLSNVMVGFFGGDAQTIPGWQFYTSMFRKKNHPRMLLVNSIIPSYAKSKIFQSFRESILNYIEDFNDEYGDLHMSEVYPIGYNEVLRNIGMPTESYTEFVDLIKNSEFADYKRLFEQIENAIYDFSVLESTSLGGVVSSKNIGNQRSKDDCAVEGRKMMLKKSVLSHLQLNMPQLYAEDIVDFQQEYSSNRYFYRKSMEDLFNPDKILVIGNKGTGKTYIYKSLSNTNIVAELQKRAQKTQYEYKFIDVVREKALFSTTSIEAACPENEYDWFYERFWLLLIWNEIMRSRPYGFVSQHTQLDVQREYEAAQKFISWINDDQFITEIDGELHNLDEYLGKIQNKRIVFIFDGLDKVVKPLYWSQRVAPLINLCRRMRYTYISPKLFLRSDLYEKMGNINNKNELSNKTINIEWSREELFSYFFKFVLAFSREDFFSLMREYDLYPTFYINKTIKQLKNMGNQPPLDEYILRQLCACFFGKYTENYNESYDWFFVNLKNANDTISLRPFIDLLTISVSHAIKEDRKEYPILHPYYYTHGKARAEAVEHHFKDLASEEGNKDLLYIFDFIQNKAPQKYKKIQLTQSDFYDLLELIINSGGLVDNKDVDSVIELLSVNGIVRSKFVRLSHKAFVNYQFALLYKYYLGLKNAGRGFKK